MANSIQSNLIRGHIDTIILSILYENDKYGYEILGDIESKSNGQYQIKQPTLYSCLKRLESQGFIYSYRGDETESGGGRRKYYALTEMGKDLFRKNQEEWEYSRTVIDKLVSDKIYQFAPIAHDEPGNEPENFYEESVTTNLDEIDSIVESTMSDKVVDDRTIFDETVANDHNSEERNVKTGNYESVFDYLSNSNSTSYIDKVSKKEDYSSAERNDNDIASPPQINNYFDEDEKQLLAEQLATFAANEKTADKAITAIVEPAVPNQSAQEDVQPAPQTPFKPYNIKEHLENSPPEDMDADDEGKSLYDLIEEATLANRERNEQRQQERFQKDKEKQDKINSRIESLKSTRPTPLVQNSEQEKQTYTAIHAESDKDIVIGREYKNIIKQLISGIGSIQSTTYQQSLAKNSDPSPESRHFARERADLNKVSDSVREMGNNVKIRTYDSDAEKKYTSMYHYNPNRLRLHQYIILYILMLVEIFVPFLIIKIVLGINNVADIPMLVCSVLFASIFPLYAAVAYFRDPYKRKRFDLDNKYSMTYRLIVFALLLIVTFLFNVVFKIDVSNPINYLMTLLIPSLLSSNVVVSLLIFKALYKSNKFKAD